MAKTAILYLDLLGVKKMWEAGGPQGVASRIAEFSDLIVSQLEFLPAEVHRNGEYTAVIKGDGVSIMCQDYDQAIGMAIHLFTQAFYATDRVSSPFWLRGAISAWSNQHIVTEASPVRARGLHVGTLHKMEDDYLRAIALEKSGFQGMRILVDAGVLPYRGRRYNREWPGPRRRLGIVQRLTEFEYPLGGDYADVLWMADRQDRYGDLCGIMASRFKRSTGDPDELKHAAWTRAVFDQVESLIWACGNQRQRRARP